MSLWQHSRGPCNFRKQPNSTAVLTRLFWTIGTGTKRLLIWALSGVANTYSNNFGHPCPCEIDITTVRQSSTYSGSEPSPLRGRRELFLYQLPQWGLLRSLLKFVLSLNRFLRLTRSHCCQLIVRSQRPAVVHVFSVTYVLHSPKTEMH